MIAGYVDLRIDLSDAELNDRIELLGQMTREARLAWMARLYQTHGREAMGAYRARVQARALALQEQAARLSGDQGAA